MNAPADTTQCKQQLLDQTSISEAADATRARPTGACTLSTESCLSRIPRHAEARLHHLSSMGPRASIVKLSRNQDGLWLRLPDFVPALHSVPGHHVTVEITGSSPDQTNWVVFVTGRVVRAKPPLAGDPNWRKGWPTDLWSRWLRVPATEVHGFSYPQQTPKASRHDRC